MWNTWPHGTDDSSSEAVRSSRQVVQLILMVDVASIPLPEDVDVFAARHLLPLLDPQLVGNVVEPLHLVQQRRYRQVSELCVRTSSFRKRQEFNSIKLLHLFLNPLFHIVF